MVLATRLLLPIIIKKFVLFPLTPSQVVEDQVHMKIKRDNEKNPQKSKGSPKGQ